jgi:hypothetical protein
VSAESFNWIWRAFIEVPAGYPDLTVFVQAISRADAAEKVKAVCLSLGYVPKDEYESWPFYNLSCCRELIEQGASTQIERRPFETAWGGPHANENGVSGWVRDPIFAVRNPTELFAIWSALPKEQA